MAETSFIGFIPRPLEISNRPDLNAFPCNVLFTRFKIENGKTIAESALYKPDLGSFRQDGEINSMLYRNIYGGESWLVIDYDRAKKSYSGSKIVRGKFAGLGMGPNWNTFFVHLTELGLAKGEPCKSEVVV